MDLAKMAGGCCGNGDADFGEGTADLAHSVKHFRAVKELEVRAVAFGPRLVRFVTHKDVNREDIDYALRVARGALT
ncbi:MAG: hypothetical protein QME76_08935 [Bacillota bacterium]|nr:hypothetical protein [Bacillota bacterium]